MNGEAINTKTHASDLVPIAEYAARIGKALVTVRQKCQRGTLPGVKLGRDWFVPADAPYTDGRLKSGEYKNWRKKGSAE